MLRSLNELRGYSIQAEDGLIGQVADFYFDDHQWVIRYLVADTGRWLPGRQVLISPESFHRPDWAGRMFPLSLTREQVEKSPDVESDKPVSRQKELELAEYYRWSPYWMASTPAIPAYGMGGVHPVPEYVGAPAESKTATAEKHDPHLRSVREVTGYRIHAADGEIGHAEDFIVSDIGWTVRYMVVDTRNWRPGGRVLVAPQWIREVRWNDAEVVVDLTMANIRRSPAYDPSEPVNEEYERRLYDYYGRPRPGTF